MVTSIATFYQDWKSQVNVPNLLYDFAQRSDREVSPVHGLLCLSSCMYTTDLEREGSFADAMPRLSHRLTRPRIIYWATINLRGLFLLP